MTPQEQDHLHVLRTLAAQPAQSQRDLAAQLGISIGKTNYLVRALLEKGLIKADNFRRSDHKVAYLYLLTPAGIDAKLRLTCAYLQRKEAEYAALRQEIDQLQQELDRSGVTV